MELAREEMAQKSSDQLLNFEVAKIAKEDDPLIQESTGKDDGESKQESESEDQDLMTMAWVNGEHARMLVEKQGAGSKMNVMILKLLSDLNVEGGDIQVAIEDLSKALDMAKKLPGIEKDTLDLTTQLASLFEQTKDFNNAIKHTKEAIELVDLTKLDCEAKKDTKNQLSRNKLELECQRAQECPDQEEELSMSNKPKLLSDKVDVTHLFDNEASNNNNENQPAGMAEPSKPADFSSFNKMISASNDAPKTVKGPKVVKDITNMIKKVPIESLNDIEVKQKVAKIEQ